jgi:predicted DCC family thiol-disulfide oxidoreductase YuxK
MISATTTATGTSVVLYDGVCGLCNASVQFLLRHDPEGRFRFAALQSAIARDALARHGHEATDLDTVYVIDRFGTPEERVLMRSSAALHCLRWMGWPWRLGTILAVVPASLLDLAYRLLARYRYRFFGKLDSCLIPAPEVRERFLDS